MGKKAPGKNKGGRPKEPIVTDEMVIDCGMRRFRGESLQAIADEYRVTPQALGQRVKRCFDALVAPILAPSVNKEIARSFSAESYAWRRLRGAEQEGKSGSEWLGLIQKERDFRAKIWGTYAAVKSEHTVNDVSRVAGMSPDEYHAHMLGILAERVQRRRGERRTVMGGNGNGKDECSAG